MTGTEDSSDAAGFSSLKTGSTDSAEVEHYYDDWAGTYDETLADWNYQAPDDAAARLAPHLRAGQRVLDVGCGTGLFAGALARHVACPMDGLDISAASLEIAGTRGGYGSLTHHDLQVTPLPVADDSYDAAACVGVLTYIADAEPLLADMCRVVRSGGPLHFTQRDDRWAERDFDAVLARLETRGLWTVLSVSEPRPYLPGNDDYGDRIGVIHVLCRVT